MNLRETQQSTQEHQNVWSQIPWYVNGSISRRERECVDAHLPVCAECRAELRQQRLIQSAMCGDSGIDHISSGSLNRLRQRLDAIPDASAEEQSGRTGTQLRARLAASIGIVAITIGMIAAISHQREAQSLRSDFYHTVSSPTKRSPDETIRAVFAPTLTLAQLQNMLDQAHLRIVAGPTEAGVYSLAPTQAKPVKDALAQLRQNPAVRFAESTVPSQ